MVAIGVSSVLGAADRAGEKPESVPAEEYPFYDLVVQSKFLTSDTTLVVIERLTVATLEKNEREYLSREFLDEQQVLQNRLPAALLDDFLFKMKTPSRLDARFGFGVRYRFVRDGVPEEPEVSLAPIPAAWVPRSVQEAPQTVGVLQFSRVGFTPREDQALVYVEENRPDGTGGGFLVWFHRRGKVWTITDTEVLWMARPDLPEQESP
ncbi:MAG: hypothetical protein ACREI9_01075 [Nitrospiraceae bacterium]